MANGMSIEGGMRLIDNENILYDRGCNEIAMHRQTGEIGFVLRDLTGVEFSDQARVCFQPFPADSLPPSESRSFSVLQGESQPQGFKQMIMRAFALIVQFFSPLGALFSSLPNIFSEKANADSAKDLPNPAAPSPE